MEDKNLKRRYFYIGLTAFLVVAACVVFFFLIFRLPGILSFLGKLLSVVQPVIIGLIIAYLVNPIANSINGGLLRLSKKYFNKKPQLVRKISNAVSVFGALAVFILVLILIIYMIVPQFIDSISSMIKVLPGQLDTFIKEISAEFERNKDLQNLINAVYEYEKEWLQNDLTGYVNSLATYFASGVWSVVSFLKDFAVGLIFALYILFNKSLLMRQFRKLLYACLNNAAVEHIFKTGKRAHRIFSGFIYGKLLDSIIIGVLCFIGISILKIPYTMLVAVVIGVTNIIPVFGPYLGGIPCAALILLTDPIKGLYFIIFIILLQALDGNFIGPKILGNSTGLSAFWVVFAIVLGGGLFGVLGMLIGVPLFAVIYYLVTTFVNFRLNRKKLPTQSDYYDSRVCEKIAGNEDLRVEIPLEGGKDNREQS
ncbi:MAG: AI-2E family transporter [Acutalibacteraceae bacterium]